MAEALAVDPLVVAVLARKFQAISRDMASIVHRTARSSLLQNGDFATGVLDDRRRILSQDEGLPLMAYGYTRMLAALVERFGDDIGPGDVFLHNDPFAGNNQAQDTGVFRPVFVDGELQWWTAAKGHLADWGGERLGGYNAGATEVWAETIRIPPLRIVRGGETVHDVWAMLLANTRLPRLVAGDIHALMAACATGEARLRELVARYGVPSLRLHADDLLRRTARRLGAEIAALPDGTYRGAAAWRQPADITPREQVAHVAVTIAGDRMVVDFAGTDPQSPRYYNGVIATTYSAAMATLLMLFDPDSPHNEGVERCIEIHVPEGSFLNARAPAPSVMGNFVANDVVAEALMKALAPVLAPRVTAGWGRGLNASVGNPRATDEAEPFFALPLLTNKPGGGGTEGCDGWSAIGPLTCGGAFAFDDYETFEAGFPIRLLRHELWPGSAGAGRWRGGFGVDVAYEVRAPSVLMSFGEDADRPFALAGGRPGAGNVLRVRAPGAPPVDVPANDAVTLAARSIVEARNAGGGGFGDPREREPELVLLDVRNGLVSRDEARDVYGVALSDDGRFVDARATRRLRG